VGCHKGQQPRREPMRALAPAFAACSLSFLIALPARADDLTIRIAMKNASLSLSGKASTTLFVTATDVRYRTRNYREGGGQDWLFKVKSGKLTVIDHDKKTYFESTPEIRGEVS
jgi:hypothetical protein